MTERRDLEEVTLQTEPIFQGKIISLQLQEVRLPDGRTARREVVKHPGAVAVMAIHEGRLLVVEQYRTALGRTLVEIPAGKLEKGEDPAVAAARELQEETGFRCGRLELVSSFFTSPGFADEIVHLYQAWDLQAGEDHPDDDEFLRCFALTPEQADAYAAGGRIRDAKTIAALYAWKIQRLGGRPG